MVVSVSKRRPKTSRKISIENEEVEKSHKAPRLFSFTSILCRLPLTFLFLFLIYLWSTSTTVISGNVVHICISSRKLNDLYCLTAGSQPGFHLPVTGEIDKFNIPVGVVDKDGEKGFVKNDTFVGETNGERVSGDPTIGESLKFVKNETFVGETAGEKVPGDSTVGESFNFNNNETFTDETNGEIVLDGSTGETFENGDHDEDQKGYNIDTTDHEENLDQDSKPKNEINLDDLVVDWDSEIGEEHHRYIKSKDDNEEEALKAVDKYLRLQRSWLSTGNKGENSGSCEGKGVYVYDLPSKFNKDLLGECKEMVMWGNNFCSYLENDAFGESIDSLGKGWFRTHQYALEPIFHYRVLKHPCRVYDESQAKLFYVPFYGGLDVLRWHFKNVSDDVKDVLAIEVIKWLGSKKSWRQNSGKDHVFVLGKISWDFRRNNKLSWGSSLLEMQEMSNPTKLLIERHPWKVNDIAVPHPTHFHPKTDEDIASWQNKIIEKPRKSLISFAGGARPGDPENIRSTLIDECASLPSDQCRFLNCTDGSCDKPESVIELFQDSEFCLQPPGDSPTRRSVFDSLISGCIPVIFDPYTAYYQYTWHLPEDHRRYSVYISKEDVKAKKVNVMEKLMAKTLREREDMRSYIVHEVLPGLVYGDSNAKFERFRDAFDITIHSLFEKIKIID